MDYLWLDPEVKEKMSREFMAECWQIRFLFLEHTIFVNDYGTLSDERRAVWKAWLEKMYPSKRIVML